MIPAVPAAAKNSPPAKPGAPCSGKHRLRLLIGEGNFSFALALIHKHDTKNTHNAQHS